jgi:hypothetical protein
MLTSLPCPWYVSGSPVSIPPALPDAPESGCPRVCLPCMPRPPAVLCCCLMRPAALVQAANAGVCLAPVLYACSSPLLCQHSLLSYALQPWQKLQLAFKRPRVCSHQLFPPTPPTYAFGCRQPHPAGRGGPAGGAGGRQCGHHQPS